MKKVFNSQFGLVLISALLLFAFSTLTSQAQITRHIIGVFSNGLQEQPSGSTLL